MPVDPLRPHARTLAAVTCLATLAFAAVAPAARADEEDAKRLLKAMSDYLAEQDAIGFSFVTDLDIVTTDLQKVTFTSSGEVELRRPDHLAVARTGGFADVGLFYDGETFTILDKVDNVYATAPLTGTVSEVVDFLRTEQGVHAPGADLLIDDVYDTLMAHVVDVKDLGNGIIDGVDCDHLAFRTEDVDWQIWIAAGDAPYPCRYTVTSKQMVLAPEYSVTISNWRTGEDLTDAEFTFTNDTDAKEVQPSELVRLSDVPHILTGGETR